MTPSEIQKRMQDLAQSLLVYYDTSEAITIARIAAEEIFGKQSLRVPMEISTEQLHQWDAVHAKLITGMPLQYALSRAWFMDFTLKVSPDVLIPRPETEELVEKIIQQNTLTAPRILDIGTGSGCIALALKKSIPGAQVYACDISANALQLAEENARAYNLDITFFQHDILNASLQNLESFDIIVSNPPYIHPDEKTDMQQHVVLHEPHLALFTPSHDWLIFYRAIADICRSHLSGWLWFEVHAQAGELVAEILIERGFQHVSCLQDMQHKNRFVAGRLGL